ncbi:hypothetical protein [Alcanivorax sp.]|uniref:hypothetical protein n=1 Tax=Alcanivorax sp. TaxID=1872427 RepID=UPI002617ADFC|nr:hypothetical protein [Alcanivorax sp.]
MNRIPENFDLSALTGEGLSQIRIDQHQIQLYFDNSSIQGGGQVLLEKSGDSKQLFLWFVDNYMWAGCVDRKQSGWLGEKR